MTLLKLENVHSFYGNSHVLHDLSIEVEENEIVALLGRNGMGKTTTLRTIVGIITPQSGRIVFKDTDIVGKRLDQISQAGIKLVPEDRRVFPSLTVRENLSIAHRQAANPRTIEEMFELFPLLRDVQSNIGQNLSGGEQQMLSIGRALIQNPDLLLLDEPTEGLAPVIVDDLREVFKQIIEENVTILITEQNVEFLFEIAERGYIIEKGRIVFEDTMKNIRTHDEVLEKHLSISS